MKQISPDAIATVHQLRESQAGLLRLEQAGKPQPSRFAASTHGEFVAWDGEGITDESGYQHYVLLENSRGAKVIDPHLSTIDCLDFLLAHSEKGTVNVIFGLGYDVTKWLADISEDMQLQLKQTTRLTIRYRPKNKSPRTFDIQYVANKWFQVTGQLTAHSPTVTVKIYDVMTFFQTTFIKALESRKIPVPEIITTGKAQRNDFKFEDIEEISQYCAMELQLLVQLANTLREEFREAGIPINSYHGPGAVANTVLRQHKIKNFRDPEPDPFMENLIRYAYFGGRFEQFGAGHHPEPVYLYDINSAYPYQLTMLPNLAGAEWEEMEEFDPTGVGLWYCRRDGEDYRKPQAAPWRSKTGRVAFPATNAGTWLLTPEARHMPVIEYGFKLKPADDRLPFEFIHEIYNKRQQWKLEGRGGERALKLAMNSIYGKLCQAIGNGGERPANHQMLWAALITSGTRAMIWDAVSQAPNDIIAIETDSVMSKVPLDLPLGPGLGQWEMTILQDATYIQSGVYYSEGGAAKNKTRGIDPKKLQYKEVMEWLASGCSYPMLGDEESRFIGIGNYGQRNKMGLWVTQQRGIQLAGGKRIHAEGYCIACKAGAGYHEAMHDLISVQDLGRYPSKPHYLPWLDDGKESREMQFAGESIRQWESPRH